VPVGGGGEGDAKVASLSAMQDVEADVRGVSTHKTCFQTTRDTVLFSLHYGVGFGLFWFGVREAFDAVVGRDTEWKFALSALTGALVCAAVLEFCSHHLPAFEIKHGGRVVYVTVDGTPKWKSGMIALLRDEAGGMVIFALPEAGISALPPTSNKLANVARVTCSYVLGFAVKYLYDEWLQRLVKSKKAVREYEVQPHGRGRTAVNLAYQFVVVFLASYTSRWMERWIGGYHFAPHNERFLAAFTGTFWFFFIWYRCYDIANNVYGFRD
jgi:hypothetical protein